MGITKRMQLEEINRHCSECGKKEMSESMAHYQMCRDCRNELLINTISDVLQKGENGKYEKS
jgi:hypothetical protein